MDLKKVVRVVKNQSFTQYGPINCPPQVSMTIHLEDGSSHDLTEDAFGKQNYEVSTNMNFRGDELYCLVLPTKKFVLVGSEAGVKHLR